MMGRTIVTGLLLSVVWATTAHADAAAGKDLYEKKCKVCHSIGNDKGKMANQGGPLDGVGGKRDAAWLKKYLADPKSVMPEAKMPKVKMTDQELQDYVDFLLTVK